MELADELEAVRGGSTAASCSLFKEKGPHTAFAAEADCATRLEPIPMLEGAAYLIRNVDAAGQAVRFEPTGDVHRVAPHVVDELVRPMMPATTGPEWMPIRS